MTIIFEENQPRKSLRLGISGKQGCGKSTAIFRIAKNPLLLDLENKLPEESRGVGKKVALGTPTFGALLRELRAIRDEASLPFDWLVTDSFTEVEKLIIGHTITNDYKNDRTKYSAYQSGPKNEVPDYFSEFLDILSAIQTKHGINILALCHTKSKLFNNPLGDDYYKAVLDLKDDTASRALKWFDCLGFVYDDIKVEKDGLRTKAEDRPSPRLISFDNSSPFFDGKCTWPVAPKIPFDIEGRWVNQFTKGLIK